MAGHYDGVQRSNAVLRELRLATDIDPADTVELFSRSPFPASTYHIGTEKDVRQYSFC